MNIQLINIIHTEIGYKERFNLLLSLYEKFSGIIYTRYSTRDNLQYINISKQKNIIVFWILTACNIVKLANKNKNTNYIIIEHLTGYALVLIFILKYCFFLKNIKLGLGLYSDNQEYFKKKIWNIENNYYKLSFKEYLKYSRIMWFRSTFDRLFIYISDFIITNSITQYEKLKFKKDIHIVHNSISNDNSLKITNHRNIDILFAGVIMPGKGICGLFESLSRIKTKNSLNISIVGGIHIFNKGWGKAILNIYSNRVSFNYLSEISYDELKILYGNTKILILPSYSEGMPRVILEALRQNCLIIASDIEAHIYLKSKGLPINLYNTGNVDNMTSIIEKTLRMKNISNKIPEEFSFNSIRKELIVFLDSIFKKTDLNKK